MFQRPRGTTDRLPEEAPAWRRVVEAFERECRLHGYQPIATPTFEPTELFSRGTGETTDIVQKEMYTFEDRGGDSLTLRPEGTPSVVRAYLQNGMHVRPQPVKLYYVGPIFRYDRPQAGRYREHHQIGVEALGDESAAVDAEVIELLWSTLHALGIPDVSLQLNSLGDPDTRPAYRQALVGYFTPLADRLCADCRNRLQANPLRLLDCKQEGCVRLGSDAPRPLDFLGEAAREHFETLQTLLRALDIPFALNHRLVRGLDYYNRTVFELWPPEAGAQSTVGAGGRYDYLAETLGGPHLPGMGFGAGLERILLNLQRAGTPVDPPPAPDVFVAPLAPEALADGLAIAAELRMAGITTEAAYRAGTPRAQLRRANNLRARAAIILGPRELEAGRVAIKPMDGGEQIEAPRRSVVEAVTRLLGESS